MCMHHCAPPPKYDLRLESEDQMFGSVKPVSGFVDLYDEF